MTERVKDVDLDASSAYASAVLRCSAVLGWSAVVGCVRLYSAVLGWSAVAGCARPCEIPRPSLLAQCICIQHTYTYIDTYVQQPKGPSFAPLLQVTSRDLKMSLREIETTQLKTLDLKT